ncbi:MAG: hypothetical protein QOF81_1305, partial [Acidimicrobiaceae bacterium]|nr:hypothetical protein [Acidimicrobiaceae bacterium]
MHGLVGSSVKHRWVLVVVALLVLVGGFTQLRHAKVDALPEFNPPQVEVQTEALGLSAQEVEQLLTVPLERNHLNGIPFLRSIRSRSVPGLSSIELTFEPGTNLFTARQLVQERLSTTAELPNVSSPPQMLQAVSSASRVMLIGLSTKKLSPIDLSVLTEFTIRPRLLGVPGVAGVSIFGARDLQLQIQVDPARLEQRGVSVDQVITTAGNALFVSPLTFLEASTPGSGGFFDSANQRLGVQHILPIKTPADLSNVAIADATTPLKLGDVATVVEDHQPLIGDASLPEGQGLLLVVEKLPGSNTAAVTHGLEAALGQLKPSLTGIQIDNTIYRPQSFIDTAIDNLRRAAVPGALLAIALLALLLLSWRAAVVAAATIPVSVVAAAAVLSVRGATFNSVVVAGLMAALALVVFDVVVMTTAMQRRVRASGGEGGGGDERPAAVPGVIGGGDERPAAVPGVIGRGDERPAAVAAVIAEVGRPLAIATVIVGLALAPFLFLDGLAVKSFLPPAALSYGLAVLASLVVALTVAPAAGALVLRPTRRQTGKRQASAGPARADRVFGSLVTLVSRRPAMAALVPALVVAALGAASMTQLHPSLVPSFKETDLLVHWDGPPGTSLEEMSRVINRAAGEVRGVDGVRSVGIHVGRAISADQVVGSGSGEMWIGVKPTADHDRTVAQVKKVIAGYPGVQGRVSTYFADQVNDLQSAGGADLVVRLSGTDFDIMNAKGAEIQRLISGVKGVKDARLESQPVQPTIQVTVDLAAAEKAGIKPGDIRRGATTLVSGLTVGSLYQDQKVFQVVVVGAPALRHDLTTISDIKVDLPAGGQIRLGDVAKITVGPSISVIKHDDVARSLDVTATVHGRSIAAVAKDVEAKLQGVSFPPEHDARVLTDHQDRSAAQQRLLLAGVLGLILIFLVFQAAFSSWRLAALAAAAIPVALAGGTVGSWIDGRTFTMGSLLGLLAIGGLAVRSSTVLLSGFQHLERNDPRLSRLAVVRQATIERGIPTAMAALVLAVAFVPFLLIGDVPGTEIVRPLAVSLLGGLCTTSLLALVVLPAGYLAVRSRRAEASPELTVAVVRTPDSETAAQGHAVENGDMVGNGHLVGSGAGNGNGHVPGPAPATADPTAAGAAPTAAPTTGSFSATGDPTPATGDATSDEGGHTTGHTTGPSPATGDPAAGAPAPATGPSTATGDPTPATGDATSDEGGHTIGPSPATGDHAAGAPAPATGPSTATGDATPATGDPTPATGDPTPHAAGHTTGPSPATAHHGAGAPGDPP